MSAERGAAACVGPIKENQAMNHDMTLSNLAIVLTAWVAASVVAIFFVIAIG
jgi:hypothetical protein